MQLLKRNTEDWSAGCWWAQEFAVGRYIWWYEAEHGCCCHERIKL